MAERGEKKTRGLTPSQWKRVKRAYESGESIRALSKRFKVRADTIAVHRDKGAWTVAPTVAVPGKVEQQQIRERTTAKVIDFTTRQVIEAVQSAGLMEELAIDLLNTVKASKIASEYALDILTRARAGEIRPASSPGEQTEADVFKNVMGGYKLFASMTREIAGLKPGMATIAEAEDVSEATTIIRKVVRPAGSQTA